MTTTDDTLGFDPADDPLGPLPAAPAEPLAVDIVPDYDVPPLHPGTVGVMVSWIFPTGDSLTTSCMFYEDHLHQQGIDVDVDPILEGSADGDEPVVRVSGFHEQVRAALLEYTGGDGVAAEAIYHDAVIAVSTGSIIGGVEARIGMDNDIVTSFEVRPQPEE